jgi:hypothetical protein
VWDVDIKPGWQVRLRGSGYRLRGSSEVTGDIVQEGPAPGRGLTCDRDRGQAAVGGLKLGSSLICLAQGFGWYDHD